MTRVQLKRRVRELTLPTARMSKAYLAETYDGIGQYVKIAMTRNGVTAALQGRIASGDFGGGRTFPEGTPVVVSSFRGQLEVFLGNQPHECDCPETLLDCFDDRDIHQADLIAAGNAGPIQRFPTSVWQIAAGPRNCTDAGIADGSLFAELQPIASPSPSFAIITDFIPSPDSELDTYFNTHKLYRGSFKLNHLPLQPTNQISFSMAFSGASLEMVMATNGFIRINGNTTAPKTDWEEDVWYQFLWDLDPVFGGGTSQAKVWKCPGGEPDGWDVIEAPPNSAGGGGRLSLSLDRFSPVPPTGDTDIKAEIGWVSVEVPEA